MWHTLHIVPYFPLTSGPNELCPPSWDISSLLHCGPLVHCGSCGASWDMYIVCMHYYSSLTRARRRTNANCNNSPKIWLQVHHTAVQAMIPMLLQTLLLWVWPLVSKYLDKDKCYGCDCFIIIFDIFLQHDLHDDYICINYNAKDYNFAQQQ